MVDVLDGDVDRGCRYSNLKLDGRTHPIPQQAGEGRDGRVRGNADSQIDGDLSGRRKRLRLARLRFWRTLIQRVVFAERDCAAAGFEAVDLVAGASDEVGEGLLADRQLVPGRAGPGLFHRDSAAAADFGAGDLEDAGDRPRVEPECGIGLVGGDDAARGRGQIAQVVPGRLAVGAGLFVRVGW